MTLALAMTAPLRSTAPRDDLASAVRAWHRAERFTLAAVGLDTPRIRSVLTPIVDMRTAGCRLAPTGNRQ